jgi:hypothetical protein
LVVLLLYLVSLPLLCVFVGIGSIIGGVSIFIGKHNWKNDAARLQAAIVDRRITQDFEDDEYYSYQVLKHELELKYTPVRAITDPGERTIWAHVGQSTWAKYEHLDAATIYYSVADPSVFFIEGE